MPEKLIFLKLFLNLPQKIVSLELIENVAIGLSFTEDGLESKIGFNNPLEDAKDPRF